MSSVLTERDGHTFIVTLNRPHRMNAMTMTMFAKLDDAWHEAADDDHPHRGRGQLLLRHGSAVAGR